MVNPAEAAAAQVLEKLCLKADRLEASTRRPLAHRDEPLLLVPGHGAQASRVPMRASAAIPSVATRQR